LGWAAAGRAGARIEKLTIAPGVAEIVTLSSLANQKLPFSAVGRSFGRFCMPGRETAP
jgi:hypothetical protein